MIVDIKELLSLEAELEKSCESTTSSIDRDAKVNMLKYLQVGTVVRYEYAYDGLCYELNKQGGLECLRNIAPVRSKDFLQPKVFELHDGSEEAQLEEQLQFYLADAERAKQRLDELVTKVVKDLGRCQIQCAEVKSRESTARKARRFCGGDVRKIADMARLTVVCETPEALKQVYLAIIGVFQVRMICRF